MGGSAQVPSRNPHALSRVNRERSMKYLTVCQGALLALSLAVVSTSASAGDYRRGPVDPGSRTRPRPKRA